MDSRTKDIFRGYLREAIGDTNASIAFSAFGEPASVSVRLNPFKPTVLNFPVAGNVPWCKSGFFLETRPVFTLDPAFHAGAYYVQDSSSMFVGHMARVLFDRFKDRKVLKVLDLCAAPGGKTTDLAASLRAERGNDFLIVANEVVKQRASVLASNAVLWGDPCVVVTSDDPSRFSRLEGFFDIILADVPCSGEGMFRKDKVAEEQWSEENVKLCQGRQRRIVADVWPALADGGVLIYSTCTFNKYENDDNVRWIADSLEADILCEKEEFPFSAFDFPGVLRTEYGFSLVPGLVRGEGQYCSALVKRGGQNPALRRDRDGRPEKNRRGTLEKAASFFEGKVVPELKGDMLKVIPEPIFGETQLLSSTMHVLLSGCAVGVEKNGTIVPDADMALSLIFKKDVFQTARLDLQSALSYLKGNVMVLPDYDKGYVTMNYGSLPLGFAKNLGGRCNNLYPKGRRIRMEII